MRIKDIFAEEKDNITSLDLINIVSHTLALNKEKIFINFDMEVKEEELSFIKKLIKERVKGKPLSYIINNKEFYSEMFHVNQHVLVPRPDTETLVEEALKIIINKSGIINVMDMGTGSGVIGITLAKRTWCKSLCIDISPNALCIAKINSVFLNTTQNVNFVCSNLFDGIKQNKIFDLILANLPYVSQYEWEYLPDDVRNFEPKLALYGGEDGTEIYVKFLKMLPYFLKEDGHILCEIGNNHQANKIKIILESQGFNTKIKKDLSDRERVVVGSWINLL